MVCGMWYVWYGVCIDVKELNHKPKGKPLVMQMSEGAIW